MSEYWRGVGKRICSIGKAVVSASSQISSGTSVPAASCSEAPSVTSEVVVGAVVKQTVAFACTKITAVLKSTYWKTVRNCLVTLCMNVAAILILYFKPFDFVPSKIVGYSLMLGALLFSIFRWSVKIRKYGKMVAVIFINSFRKKSLYAAVEKYVLEKIRIVSLAYAGLEIGSSYIPALKSIPSVSSLVKYFVKIFRKQLVVYFLVLSAYTVIFWCVKHFILVNMGVHFWSDLFRIF